MAAGKERGLGRVQDKLNASISEGKYYEAHQLYKTLYFRLLGQNKFLELLDLLENGARLLLEKNQLESGADLAITLIDVLVKSKVDISEEWVSKVTKLFSLMNPSMPERETFVTNATRWSMGEKACGHSLFHAQIAKIYWEQKNTQAARQHFLRSCDGESFASMLIEIHTTRGFKSEVDIFIAQAVLHALTMRRKQLASDTFKYYTTRHPAIMKSDLPYPTPILNFTCFVLQCIDLKNVEKFKEVVSKYQKHIVAKDSSYTDNLEKIGNIYFGIPLKPKQRGNGLMGNLLNSLMSNMDVGESSSDDEYSNYSNARSQPIQTSDLE